MRYATQKPACVAITLLVDQGFAVLPYRVLAYVSVRPHLLYASEPYQFLLTTATPKHC